MKLHFFKLINNLFSREDLQHFPHMIHVIHRVATINKNIIKIDDDKFSDKRFQYLIHESHESAWCIRKTERHHHPLVKSLFSLEHSFPFISRSYTNLVISTLQVNFRKKILAPDSISNMSPIRGIGNRYFTVILFIARLSTQICQLPSFFGTSRVGTMHGLILSRKCPFRINLSTCSCKIAFSFGSFDNVASSGDLLPALSQYSVGYLS
jgi:hypothetical protein